jgi:methionine-rich copper-binding protein CopC
MKRTIISLFLIVLTGAARVEAHAFLKDAEPRVGSTVQTSPSEIRIRFTENIEPAFSSIQVFDASGKEVDKRDLHLDRSDHALLQVSLPRMSGIYKVVWRVVSVDTHDERKLHVPGQSLGARAQERFDAYRALIIARTVADRRVDPARRNLYV